MPEVEESGWEWGRKNGEQRMSARFQGLLLIHVGFVKNTASRLRQTEGTPHLRSALAKGGTGYGKQRVPPGSPSPSLVSTFHPVWWAGSGVPGDSAPSGCLGSGDSELLGESQRHR